MESLYSYLRNESYIGYKRKVLELLKKHLREQNSSVKIRTEYRLECDDRCYRLDLVGLDDNEKIKKVYEIKTPQAVLTNINFIKEHLLQYKIITGAEVYLVYLKDDAKEELTIESLEDLCKEKSKSVALESSYEYSISLFSEFYDKIKKVCNDDKGGTKYFFRGHSKCIYEPIPSVFRKDRIIKCENRMYREAIRRNPSVFTENMSTFDNLVKMQHYELPTRLLDITTNPLVALYFACKEYEDEDGELLIYPMLDEQIKYYDSDSVCILSNLAKLPEDFEFKKDKGRLVYDIQQDKPNFNGEYLKAEATQKVFCVKPKLNNERIVSQQGAFFIFGMGSSKNKPAQILDKPTKIRIKADCKKDILKDLQIFGINEATLFPETDKIMKQIKTEIC